MKGRQVWQVIGDLDRPLAVKSLSPDARIARACIGEWCTIFSLCINRKQDTTSICSQKKSEIYARNNLARKSVRQHRFESLPVASLPVASFRKLASAECDGFWELILSQVSCDGFLELVLSQVLWTFLIPSAFLELVLSQVWCDGFLELVLSQVSPSWAACLCVCCCVWGGWVWVWMWMWLCCRARARRSSRTCTTQTTRGWARGTFSRSARYGFKDLRRPWRPHLKASC